MAFSDAMTALFLQEAADPQPTSRAPIDSLSNRELQMLSDGHTKHDMAKQMVWSVKTIEYYRERMKKKLNIKSAQALAQFAARWKLGDTD